MVLILSILCQFNSGQTELVERRGWQKDMSVPRLEPRSRDERW